MWRGVYRGLADLEVARWHALSTPSIVRAARMAPGSMARRVHVVGVLLASALARPLAQSTEEVARTRRALTGYVMDDSTIRTAVTAWFDDRSGAEATYGHISRRRLPSSSRSGELK